MKPALTSPVGRYATLLAAGLLLGVPIVASIGTLVAGAITDGADTAGRVMRDAQVWRSIALSVWIAGAGTLLALCGAIAIALLLAGESRSGRFVRTIVALPLPIPNVAAAVATLLLLSQSGWLSRVAALVHVIRVPQEFPALVLDPWAFGVIVAVVWKELPFLALVAVSLQALRGRSLTDAARTLGASPWQAARHVTLPLLLRGMAPAVIAVFVFVLGSLELPLVLAPSSPLALPMLIQERRQSLDGVAHGEAYVIALLATALALSAAVLHEVLRSDDA